ncbi:MAG: Si-specific NAD(P)(+) transhydrogenase, partial [bacterium]
MNKYDLIVIGSGPSGEKAAIQAAKLNKRVLVVDKRESLGGNALHTGTIPSKTLRESVMFVELMRSRAVYGISVRMEKELSVNRLMHRKNAAVNSLAERVENTFDRNGIDHIQGEASFVDPTHVAVRSKEGSEETFETDFALIGTGSRPYRPSNINFNQERVRDSDTILLIEKIPRSMTVIGAGVIGCEYATLFSKLGVKVNLVNPRQVLLDFLDLEISNALAYLMREAGIRIRLSEHLKEVETDEHHVYAHMDSGKVLKSEYLLFANGRSGNTRGLGLENVGIEVNRRDQISVNAFFQTSQPNIYAAGDVIGFPSLAATSMEQGRLTSLHAFNGLDKEPETHLLPTGIYTIPEISTVGATEEQLTREKVPYEVGAATYREIARGQIVGNTTGRLKLLFHRETLKLLGVHIIGEGATDLVHIG